MTRIMKKVLSLFLCLILVTLGSLQIGVSLGVNLASAGFSSELWLMEGLGYMTKNGTRQPINGKNDSSKPYFYKEGESTTAYVPMSAIKSYAGGSVSVSGSTATLTPGGSEAYSLTNASTAYTQGTKKGSLAYPAVIKGGELYLADKDILKLFGGLKSFVNYDTGLIVYSTAALSYSNSYSSLSTQIAELDALLFTPPSASGVISDMTAKMGSLDAHPKLLVNQDRFDLLRSVYEKTGELTEDEATLNSYIMRVISQANAYFVLSFKSSADNASAEWKTEDSKNYYRQPYYLYDDSGNRLYGKSTYKNSAGEEIKLTEYWQTVSPWKTQSSPNGEGYDVGGRSNLDVVSRHLKFFGFAWQITGENRWADAFYMAAMELSKWEHWGEGHFLDCADGAFDYALGFDWIYNAFKDTAEGKAKLRQMAETLFVLGVEVGYNGMNNKTTYTSAINDSDLINVNLKNRKQRNTLHSSKIMGSNWGFQWSNNWQMVCTSGMIVSALAIMEYSDMRTVASEVVSEMTKNLNVKNCLLYYAPDGSYLESAGYWSYATKTLMFTIASLESALGKTYGFLDTVGLQGSYYFASRITDPNYYAWNYHDASRSRVESSTFYLAARMFGDPNIALSRDLMLESGKIDADIYDTLFYDASLSEGGQMDNLDYYGKGIDTVTVRSGWDSDAIFAGLHAGANKVTHGNIDSGNFYLVSGNVVWFGDRGGENYNVSQFKDLKANDYFDNNYRYLYYKTSIVSHNSVFLISKTLDMGQAFNGMSNDYAKIVKFKTDQFGAIAVANMTPQFNPVSNTPNTSICSSAKRGLLFTNSRSSVIIQDEMTFKTPQTLVWSAETDKISSVSEDGRTVYLRSSGGNGMLTMRVSIVSEDKSLKFTVLNDPIQTFLTYNTTVNGGKLVTKTGTGNQLASDPLTRLVVKVNNATKFNFAICCELIEDNREVVGYEWTPISEWQTNSDLWVRDANAWIESEGKGTFKYKKSDLVAAMQEYEAAATDAERFVIVKRINTIIGSIDTSVIGVQDMITTCRTYISKYKIIRGTTNSDFKQIFFSNLKLICGFDA